MRVRFSSLYLILIFTVFAFTFISKVNAASSSSILVNMAPPNPAPGENVTITLNSYANNLDTVLITWFVNGKSSLSGIGKKNFSLSAGSAGSETQVTAQISLPEGSVETRMTIRPSTMVLLWQANDSYVPPFYEGKALPSPDSEIRIVAMPEIKTSSGVMTNPRNMTYSWKKDYTNDAGASGYGKNSFLFIGDYLENSSTIEVVASTIDQQYQSSANITVGTVEPKILFYKNDDTVGTMWEKALENPHRVTGSEVVVASPYFISPKDIRIPTLNWSWFINDRMVNTGYLNKNTMPIRAEPGTSGTSKLKLQIENQYKIFGTIDKEINIEF